jgi:hypothetical protein
MAVSFSRVEIHVIQHKVFDRPQPARPAQGPPGKPVQRLVPFHDGLIVAARVENQSLLYPADRLAERPDSRRIETTGRFQTAEKLANGSGQLVFRLRSRQDSGRVLRSPEGCVKAGGGLGFGRGRPANRVE